jgi:hypothetical protein
MGQQKGNPTPSYQNQAYETLRPNTGARENRDFGNKPVMIDDATTLNEVVDITFETDAVAAMVSASLISTGTQLAAIMAYTASLLSVKLHSGSLINFANDAAAATGGVPVGNLYHTAGAVKVRLT